MFSWNNVSAKQTSFFWPVANDHILNLALGIKSLPTAVLYSS